MGYLSYSHQLIQIERNLYRVDSYGLTQIKIKSCHLIIRLKILSNACKGSKYYLNVALHQSLIFLKIILVK